MAEQPTIRLVEHDSPEYWATVALRDAVLRRPLGLKFTPEELAAECRSLHIAGFCDETLAGCLVLVPGDGGRVRMRQVAVAPELQRRGIGRALVAFSERLAVRQGFTAMILHARDTAVPFYENLGYVRVGRPFEDVTILHWEMAKDLTESL